MNAPGDVGGKATAVADTLAVCELIEANAEASIATIGIDEEKLYVLLSEREQLFFRLSQNMSVWQAVTPGAGTQVISGVRGRKQSEAVKSRIIDALIEAHRSSAKLATRLAERTGALREELSLAGRNGIAHEGYQALELRHRLEQHR